MPLDMTAGPPATGSGPPGLAGPPGAGPPTGPLAVLFAALLAQQAQAEPTAPPGTMVAAAGTSKPTSASKTTPKSGDAGAADPQTPPAPGLLDPAAINWAALAALQALPPVPAQTAPVPGGTSLSGAPTIRNEVMDTASPSVPAAVPAQTDVSSSGLLPLSTVSQIMPVDSGMVGVAPPADSQVNALPQVVALPADSSVRAVPSAAESPKESPVSKAMTAALSPALAAVPAGAKSQTEAAAQIALQNSVIPANNAGRAETPQAAAANPATPSTEAEKSAAPPAPAVVTPITAGAAKAPVVPVSANGQGRGAASGDVPKGASRRAADDKPPSSDQALDSQAQDSVGPSAPPPIDVTAAGPKSPTVAGPEQPLTGAERAQIVRQVADGVGAVKPQVLANGQGQMTLQLHPKEWGDLRVTVQLAPAPAIDGVKQTTVVAHVVASSPVVKAALEKHSGDLNQALRETGLRLERLTVTVQASSAAGQSGAATGDGRSFGQRSQEQWQGAPPQTGNGNGGLGSGSSSFASFSERQGGNAFQSPAAPRSAYTADEGDAGVLPVPSRLPTPNAGFDQRV